MASKLVQQPKEIKTKWWSHLLEHLKEHWYIYLCVVLTIGAAIFFMIHQNYDAHSAIDSSIWGQYGDFVGGVLGTLISVLSVYYLIRTLKEQQKGNEEIAKNNSHIADVYKLQQFNDNFSTLFSIYEKAVGSYRSKNSESQILIGRDAFITMAQNLFKENQVKGSSYEEYKIESQSIFDEKFHIPNRDIASVHFRTLYQLFALIYNSNIDEGKKVLYAKMIRSQLCEEELLLLRYNCHCHYGVKMRMYVNRYNLLKHLPLLSLGEFAKWRNFLGDEQKINRLDTEFIALRKHIYNAINGKTSDSKQIKIDYSPKYSLMIEAAEDNKSLSICLTFNNTTSLQESNSADKTFNSFTPKDLENLLSDFLLEMFVYSNFAEYNSPENIKIETSKTEHSTSEQTSVRLVVSKNNYQLMLSYDDLYAPSSSVQ